MANGRCRMHGGPSTGPRTPEGQERSRKANWKHGRYSRKYLAEEAYFRALSGFFRTKFKTLSEVGELQRRPSAQEDGPTMWVIRRLLDAAEALPEPIPPESLQRKIHEG